MLAERVRRVVIAGPCDLDLLQTSFPACPLATDAAGEGLPVAHIGPEWDDPDADLLTFDRLVHHLELDGPFDLRVEVARPHQVLLRFQRLWPWTNAASETEAFRRFFARHTALHDLSLPLVRADLDHAHDTWQWVLRLQPEASLEVQLAALLHDIERLESEARARIEQHAPDYQAFKDAHAERGALWAAGLLADLFDPGVVGRVATLVADHERAGGSQDRALLGDADALSFFALNSAGYLAWFGPEQTRRKVAWTWERLSPGARPWLGHARLPRAVRALVDGGR